MKKYILAILAIILSSAPALAKNDMEIVATVGKNVISTIDVKGRLELAISSSGLKPSPEVKEKLYSQILRTLIDENLYKQEAEKLNITLSEQEIKGAVMSLEQKNNIKAGSFKEFVKNKGISYEFAMEQLKAQLLWNKLVNRQIRPKIVITDREVGETMEHISHSGGVSELSISEIMLPVNTPKDDKSVKSLADKLVNELRGGSDFAAVAKEFSRSNSAEAGGDMGWLLEDHIDKNILSKVRNLQIGDISDPFLVDNSYHIVKLNNRRAIVNTDSSEGDVEIKQGFVPIPQNSSKEKADEIAGNIQEARSIFKTCDDFPAFAKKINSVLDTQTIKTQIKDLNGDVRNAVINTPAGKLTPLISGPGGIYLFAICKKPPPVKSVVEKDKIMEVILRSKLDVQSQAYLRDLRKNAFIEIRQ